MPVMASGTSELVLEIFSVNALGKLVIDLEDLGCVAFRARAD
jgi:hypothetical protein